MLFCSVLALITVLFARPSVFVKALLLGAFMPLQWGKAQKREKEEGFTKVPQNPAPPPPKSTAILHLLFLIAVDFGGVGWGVVNTKKKITMPFRASGSLAGWAGARFARLARFFSFLFLFFLSLFLLSISPFSFLSPPSPFYLSFLPSISL